MKKILALGFLALAFMTSGCDYVDGPYTEGPVDTTSTNTIQKKVLLEDFTGHACVYCPDAHVEADRLKAFYGDRLIPMVIHASTTWAAPQPVSGHPGSFTYDFRTNEGTEIAKFYEVIKTTGQALANFPIGMVDRAPLTSLGDWDAQIASQLSQDAVAGIEISSTYDSTSRQVSATITIDAAADYANDASLCVYILEDSIVNWQKNHSVYDSLYVHRHVLRGAMTPAFGESIGSLSEGQAIVKTYANVTLPRADMDAKKVILVAILTDTNSKEVLQAEDKRLYP